MLLGILAFACATKPDTDATDATDYTDGTDPTNSIPGTDDTGTTVTDTETTPTDTGTTPTDTGTTPTDTEPTETTPETAADCFGDIWGDSPPVDYDQFGPVMGTHCLGTNHQDIQDIQRVVFVGDSITVGSPPTGTQDWYRNRLADELAARFGLEAPAWEWENVNLVDGVVYEMESGDFASCAKYGARTDDLIQDNQQLEDCMPEDKRQVPTLIVMTIGGNDLYSLLEDITAGVDEATLQATFDTAMLLMRGAAEWVTEPGRFPNGGYLVFANMYDFTDEDGALDMATCPGAELIGMDAPLLDPVLWPVMKSAQEEFLSIAVDTQTDMVFLGEEFCGHGYNNTDASGRCYRGSGAETWLDFTCMHPGSGGHEAIADMVMSVVEE